MSEFPALPVNQLKLLISDPQELAKGTAIADKGGLKHLARYGNKLYAEAEGSGAAPYKPQIVFDDKGHRGRCSCMAARSRPFCKHAAALLVQWSRDPSAFALSTVELATEPAAGGGEKKSKVKTGKVDVAALMRAGVEQTLTLVRELALSGIGTISTERVEQIRALAETLRAERLRRLSARLLELADALDVAVVDFGLLDAESYAGALADLWLTARRITKHLDGGEVLTSEYVETLIGKTWTKKDREAIGPLDLVEVAFVHDLTADDFVIRESRLISLSDGAHYSEKQILPAFLAKRSAPKPSYAGLFLQRANGGRYPGFAPTRLDLSDTGKLRELQASDLDRLSATALPGVAAALAALAARRKDVFAPTSLPVSIALSALYAEDERLYALDADGQSLLIDGDAATLQLIGSALYGAALRAIVGDVQLHGALPSLSPLAVVVVRDGAAQLISLPAPSVENLMRASKSMPTRKARWIDTGRALGVSPAALVLGEVREELADALSEGLGALSPRRAEGMAVRLTELSLAKPAALLSELAQRPDPLDKLEDVIRLLQVLGIGLSRLAASKPIEQAALVASPLHPSIRVLDPKITLPPRELLAELGRSQLKGHSRAIAIDRALAACDHDTLRDLAPTLLADGSIGGLLAQRLRTEPALALEIADIALQTAPNRRLLWSRGGQYVGAARVAKRSAILLLSGLSDPAARTLLQQFRDKNRGDSGLHALAMQALRHPATTIDPNWTAGLQAGNREDRTDALHQYAKHGWLQGLPAVRQLGAHDPSQPVRYVAWWVQATLLDVDAVPSWISTLAARADNDTAAHHAIIALGAIGDSRAIGPLLDAFADTYKPAVIAEALRAIGPAVLPALVDRCEAEPALAERKVAQEIAVGVGVQYSIDLIAERIALGPLDTLTTRATCYLKLASANPHLKTSVAEAVQAALVEHPELAVPADLKRALTRALKPAKG